MKLLPTVLLTAGGLFLLSKVSYFGAASRLSYSLASVNPVYNGAQPILQLVISVKNPTNQQFTVQALTGDVVLNGTYVGSVSGFTQTVILPLAQSQLPVSVALSLTGLVSDIISLFTGSAGQPIVAQFQGTINVDGNVLPLTLKYTLAV